jgi:hypothetical protein
MLHVPTPASQDTNNTSHRRIDCAPSATPHSCSHLAEPSQQQRSPQVPALGPDTHPSSPGDSRPHPHQGPAFGFSYDTPSSQGGGSNQDGSAVAAAGAPEAGTSGAGGSSVGQQLVEEPWEPWFPLPVRLQDHLPASLQHNLVRTEKNTPACNVCEQNQLAEHTAPAPPLAAVHPAVARICCTFTKASNCGAPAFGRTR